MGISIGWTAAVVGLGTSEGIPGISGVIGVPGVHGIFGGHGVIGVHGVHGVFGVNGDGVFGVNGGHGVHGVFGGHGFHDVGVGVGVAGVFETISGFFIVFFISEFFAIISTASHVFSQSISILYHNHSKYSFKKAIHELNPSFWSTNTNWLNNIRNRFLINSHNVRCLASIWTGGCTGVCTGACGTPSVDQLLIITQNHVNSITKFSTENNWVRPNCVKTGLINLSILFKNSTWSINSFKKI